MSKLGLGLTDQLEKKTEIHLGFIFASPLVIEIDPGDIKDDVAPIGFKNEFMEILESLQD
jgi:hypothetical protein